jgi:hypothetical protein
MICSRRIIDNNIVEWLKTRNWRHWKDKLSRITITLQRFGSGRIDIATTLQL